MVIEATPPAEGYVAVRTLTGEEGSLPLTVLSKDGMQVIKMTTPPCRESEQDDDEAALPHRLPLRLGAAGGDCQADGAGAGGICQGEDYGGEGGERADRLSR